jgi:hypothetical protein
LEVHQKHTRRWVRKEYDASYVVDTADLWEDSSVLPAWMKDYFRWHKEQRLRLNESNWGLIGISS